MSKNPRLHSRLIKDFEEAVRAHELINGLMPEHREAVQQRYLYTKNRLRSALSIIEWATDKQRELGLRK
jgi:hypothetical protein